MPFNPFPLVSLFNLGKKVPSLGPDPPLFMGVRGCAHPELEPFFTGHALGGQTSELSVQMATKPA